MQKKQAVMEQTILEMSNNTRYLVLTDYDNRGTVIKQEGRKFYEYDSKRRLHFYIEST